ncbi:MAG: Transcriptional regulatory protein ZraR [Deltaproteobacteria bacterium ADurb.Bin207]|jgi:PAS domain S-box-containing protein|nr:MAG: Transcriptional regulatory protein ZraR [Deltaproteobacteria bacterium ADurb.Bin207]
MIVANVEIMPSRPSKTVRAAPAGQGNCRDPVLDSINEGVFTVDGDWRITTFNRAAEKITGISREEAIGQRCSEVFRATICEGSCALKQAIATQKPVVNTTVTIIDARGRRIPIKVSAAILRGEDGKALGGVETFQDLRQMEELRKQLLDKQKYMDIVGKSAPLQRLLQLLPAVAESDAPVLIQGPSGTGKELFAKAIHQLSPRKDGPFVAVNCGALPDTLLESELFGYVAGAFTGANKDKPGRFALAHQGTLFLDEIGDISPALQVRLLRVLQEMTFEPLGAVKSIHTNVRIISATHRNLTDLVQQGTFREDLYYRIRVVGLDIPPLVNRREDIPLLMDHFIDTLNRLHGFEVAGISPEAYALLLEHDFPGNIRELRNVLEHAFVLCHQGLIRPEHLPAYLRRDPALPPSPPHRTSLHLPSSEREMIQAALQKHTGNRALAARELGIDPSTLYRKIKRLKLPLPERDGRGKRSWLP